MLAVHDNGQIYRQSGAINGLYFYPKAVQERAFELDLTDRETVKKQRQRFMTLFYVVVEELIPEISVGEHSNIGVILFLVGFTLMMTLDVALG